MRRESLAYSETGRKPLDTTDVRAFMEEKGIRIQRWDQWTTEHPRSEEEKQRELTRIANLALTASTHRHRKLETIGGGRTIVGRNRFGDKSLHADREAENTVIALFALHNVPVRFLSEESGNEHGITNLTDNPEYLVVLDGLDGSSVYKNNNLGKYDQQDHSGEPKRYGTMLGIYPLQTDEGFPTYDDALYSGIMEHPTSNLFYAEKDQGAWVRNIETGIREELYCSTTETITPGESTIYAMRDYDDVFETDVFTSTAQRLEEQGYDIQTKCCTSTGVVDLVRGATDIVWEAPRKDNLEFLTAARLVTEAGGVMIASDGTNLSQQGIMTYLQGEELGNPRTVIMAGTKTIAHQARALFAMQELN